MIAIINYGMGNLGSVQNMLKRVGVQSVLITHPDQLNGVTKIILPGVGAFDTGMNYLAKDGWIPKLNELVLVKKVPILGICLGMQLMTNSSEEGKNQGLNWVNAQTKKFPSSVERIPHMGWNRVTESKQSRLLGNLEDHKFYFVHSYYVDVQNADDMLLQTTYKSVNFCSAFEHENIIGVQFHPEKSHRYGLEVLKNFSEKY